MTYTGQSGVSFDRAGRISMLEVLQRIEETTGGLLRPEDFVPSPCAHPLCYQIAYLLLDPDGRAAHPVHAFHGAGGALRLPVRPAVPGAVAAAGSGPARGHRPAVDRGDGDAEAERALAAAGAGCCAEMFPQRAQRCRGPRRCASASRRSKAIYVHSHMDEETFDTERVAQCCDSNCYPDGTHHPGVQLQRPLPGEGAPVHARPPDVEPAHRRGAAVLAPAAHRDQMTGCTGRLAGKRCLITGGSRGLGLAIGLAFARQGARVAFTFNRNQADAGEARTRRPR